MNAMLLLQVEHKIHNLIPENPNPPEMFESIAKLLTILHSTFNIELKNLHYTVWYDGCCISAQPEGYWWFDLCIDRYNKVKITLPHAIGHYDFYYDRSTVDELLNGRKLSEIFTILERLPQETVQANGFAISKAS